MAKQNESGFPQKLPKRQRVVTQLYTCGASHKEIATALKMKPSTVGSHLKKVREKMQVRSNTAMVAHATLHGLVLPPCLKSDQDCPWHLDWSMCAAITQRPVVVCTASPTKEQKDDELL